MHIMHRVEPRRTQTLVFKTLSDDRPLYVNAVIAWIQRCRERGWITNTAEVRAALRRHGIGLV